MNIWMILPSCTPVGILTARPDIKVTLDQRVKRVIAAELSCAEGCPLETWQAEAKVMTVATKADDATATAGPLPQQSPPL